MDRSDGRKRTPQGQQKSRKLVIALRIEGLSNQEVARRAGLSVSHASKIWQRYKKEGKKAIRQNRRGRRWGEQRALSPAKEEKVHELLISGIPNRDKVRVSLWTHEMVKLLIRQMCGVELPIRTVREYLRRWSFTPQKPIKFVSEQNSHALNCWLVTEYPTLVARAKEEKVEIHWVSSKRTETCTYAVRRSSLTGRKEVVRLPFTKTVVTMVSSITMRGKVRFAISRVPSWPFSLCLGHFMDRLLEDAKGKIFVIFDNLRSHHDKNIDYFLKRNEGRIEIFHIPSDLNDTDSVAT